MTNKTKNWIIEFYKIAPDTLEINGYTCDLKPAMLKVKSFIQSLLIQSKQDTLEEVKEKVKRTFNGYGGTLGFTEVELSNLLTKLK